MSLRRFKPSKLDEFMNYSRALAYSVQRTGDISDYFPQLADQQGEIFRGTKPNSWGEIEFIHNMNSRSGAFYELLSHQIFGGTLMGSRSMSGFDGFKPDIVDYKMGIIREVKSHKWGDSLKLTDHKIGKYAIMQAYRFFLPENLKELLKDFQIFFDCFKHNLTTPSQFFLQKTKNKYNLFLDIFNTLSQETSFLLSLPFSIIWKIHNLSSSKYDGDMFDSLSRFTSPLMQDLLTAPHKTLEDQLKLNPDDYRVKQTRIPKTMQICGRDIKPFPVLLIKHRSKPQHDKWVKKFIEEKKDYLEAQAKFTRDSLRYNIERIRGEDAGVDNQTAVEIIEQFDFLASLIRTGKLLEQDSIKREPVPF